LAIDLTVPDWVHEKIMLWVELLNMQEWTITVALDLVPNEDRDCAGLATSQPDINLGQLTLRADIEDTKEWEITIVHELLHVKHSRIDSYFEIVVAPNLNGVAPWFAWETYKRLYEPFVHSMAVSLIEIRQAQARG